MHEPANTNPPADPNDRSYKQNMRDLLKVCLILLALFIGVVIFAVQHALESANSSSCMHELKMIHMALRDYLAKHGTFPPAYLCEENENPVNSWRIAIAPDYAYNFPPGKRDHPDAPDYDNSQPWNGPHNIGFHLDKSWSWFRCPSDTQSSPATTNYVAVVGSNTMWPGREPLKPAADGSDNEKILVIEVTDSDILWMEPRDLTLDEALDSLKATKGVRLGSPHRDGIHYVTALGAKRTLDPNIDRESLRKLFVRDSTEVPAAAGKSEIK